MSTPSKIQKIDSLIESAKELKFDPLWEYDLATDALRCKVPGYFKIFRIAQALASAYEYPCVSVSSAQSVFYRNPSAFICVHLRLIFVSRSDRTRKTKFELFPIQEKIEPANYDQAHSCLNGLTESPQSTQRAQRIEIPAKSHKKAAPSRLRTRMMRIARIFTILRPSNILI